MSASPGFVHLHLHTEYSLLDGGNRIDRLIERVKQLGMSAVAVTDHGNLFGAVEFYRKAKAAGIKPILGIEAYVAPGDRTEKAPTGIQDGGFHLVLLAENNTGWQNLLTLSSDSFINGFYYKPRMDKSTLTRFGEGLIAINGHLGSSLAHHLLQYDQTGHDAHYEHALDEARWHAENFGVNERGEPRFFVEVQRIGVEEQERINPHLIRLARELDLPIVCDNDAHFLTADDHDVHDTLCCISMQKTKDSTDRLRYAPALYVKSPQEMAEAFANLPEALENTVRIAERCNVDLDFDTNHAPIVKVSHDLAPAESDGIPAVPGASMGSEQIGKTESFVKFCSQFYIEPFDATVETEIPADELKRQCNDALRQLCEAGLYWRYHPDKLTDEIRARLDWELKVVADKGISAYFLIVWDFVNWAHQRGIPAFARGSGVGTMVGYVLGLSNACPIKYGLLFERFTDPDRSEYPDIDIDICQNGRAEVIDYVRQKYGHVAQIITFGRLKAKAAIKDVARVMGLSATEGQRLSNLVPNELNITLDEALTREPAFREAVEQDERVKRVIEHARGLEHHARHAGVHAAGVVIATQPLDRIVPLCKATGSDDIITQWDGPTCERVGLLKMDFLGLRTLSTIERAKTLIRRTLSEDVIRSAVGKDDADPLDLERLAYDDQRVFDLFRRGDTAGVFQFESGGMRQLLIEMQPDRLEDLIAANALYRPGPMELIPQYNLRKQGKQEVPQVHEIVDHFTRETYGIMVYQEQVMQIVHGLGDISLREAYTLIKAISKKNHSVIDAVRPRFIDGAMKKGLSATEADRLFDLILKFAGYGFNKSHSTGYAIIAYQTGYLKTYFPNQYMAALLTFESQARKVESWVPYLEDCKRTIFPDHTPEQPHVGVEVMPADINLSAADFTVVFGPDEPREHLHGHIRFGLSAIKGAGHAAMGNIFAERETGGPFTSLFDFCDRIDLRSVNRSTVEALIKAGAFDSIHGRERRSALMAALDDAIRAGQSAASDRRTGQATFFNSFADSESDGALQSAPSTSLPAVAPWSMLESLLFEKEVLGFHASGHPLDLHEETVRAFCSHRVAEVGGLPENTPVVLGGIVTRVRAVLPRSGRNAGSRMAWVGVQDKTGEVEAIAFSDAYARFATLLQQDAMVILVGRVDRKRAEPTLVIDRVFPIENAAQHLAACIELDVVPAADPTDSMDSALRDLRSVLQDAASMGGTGAEGRAADVLLHLYVESKCVTIRPNLLRVVADGPLLTRLRSMLGEKHVHLRGAPPGAYLNGPVHGSNGGRARKWASAKAGEVARKPCPSIDRS